MTTAELLTALEREYPNGLSFDPMTMRLLRQRIPFEDQQIEELKTKMFQLGSGLWFCWEMISDKETLSAFLVQTFEWLNEHRCFSVERLFEHFRGVLRHINTPEDCATLLLRCGTTVTKSEKGGHFCFPLLHNLNDSLAAISKRIAEWLEETDGTLTFSEIEAAMPYLSAEALECIRAQFLPEVHAMEIGGVPCWCSTEAIQLPEDFAEKLTTAVDTLVLLGEKVTAAKLEFALNLSYCTRFRDEYAFRDNDTFMHVCAKYYQGENDVFPNGKKPGGKKNDGFTSGARLRGLNTRFCNLGVPIGAELSFTKDGRHITCTVLNDSNQVEYSGRAWSISALAVHLLGVSSANGFCHFSYEGETLSDRRARLERQDAQDDYQAEEMQSLAEVQEATGVSSANDLAHSSYKDETLLERNSRLEQEDPQDEYRAEEMAPPPEAQEAKDGIVGLEGRPLSPSTWRLFRSIGTSPRVAEWARRVENGESVESIASESGLTVSTVKQYTVNRRRYFAICEKNGIVPEGGTNV